MLRSRSNNTFSSLKFRPRLSKRAFLAIALVFSPLMIALAQAPAPAPGAAGAADGSAKGPIDAKKATKELEQLSEELFLQGLMDPFDYDPRGRKDPFMQPVLDRPVAPGATHGPLLPLQKFDISQLRLIGILWDVKRPRAMIQDPNQKTHIVGPYTKIGIRNGYIAVIREGELVVVETNEDASGRLTTMAQIMKLIK